MPEPFTHKPPRGPVRGPSEMEGSFFFETIMDHVATAAGLSPQLVREANLFAGPAAMAAAVKNPLAADVEKQSKQYASSVGIGFWNPKEGYLEHPITGL